MATAYEDPLRRRLGQPNPGAMYGIYPKPSHQLSTNLNDAALRQGVQAIAPGVYAPAAPLPYAPPPMRLNAATDPRSTIAASIPQGLGAVPPGATIAPQQPQQLGVPPDIPPIPIANPNVGGAAPAAVVAPPPVVTQPGTNAAPVRPANVPAGRPNQLGGLADTNAQVAALQASNAAVPLGTTAIINNGGDEKNKDWDRNRTRYLMEQAINHGIQSRRGNSNEGVINALAGQLNAQDTNRARLGEAQLNADTQQLTTGMREAGDSSRLGVSEAGQTARTATREAGDQSRAAMNDARQREALALQQEEFGLKKTAATYDNATKARMEAVQAEIASATTPEAQRRAAEKLAALSGRVQQDQFKAIEIGGGQEMEGGFPITRPKGAIIFNSSKGTWEQVNTGGAAAATPLPAGLVVGAATKQPAGTYEVAGKTVTIKDGKVVSIK